MAELEHPLFYHAPVSIRFRIGGENQSYLDRSAAARANRLCSGALDRAAAIYRALPEVPDLHGSTDIPMKKPAESLLTVIRQRMGLPVLMSNFGLGLDEDGDTHAQVQFYWDLSGITAFSQTAFCKDHSGRYRRLGLEKLCVQRLSDRAWTVPLPPVR